MLYKLFRWIFLIIAKVYLRLGVRGRENIPRKGGFILASNHVSFIDPGVLGCACFRPLSYMARDTLFDVPVLGPWMRAVNCIPVKRKSADISAIKEAMKRVKQGGAIGLFPEGTRQTSEVPERAEAGVGFLAAKLEVPVLPAFIKGAQNALPKGSKFLRPAKVTVFFGTPVLFNKQMSRDDIAQAILEDMRQLAAESSKNSK